MGFVVVLAALATVAVGCVMPPSEPPPPAACAPGTFSASGTVPCSPAPIGTYVAGSGATAPTPCPANTTTLAVASTSGADCVQVPAFAWNQTVPVNGQSAPFSRTVTSGVVVTATLNCSGTTPITVGNIQLRELQPGVLSTSVAGRGFSPSSPAVCGGTYVLPPVAASFVFEAGNRLVAGGGGLPTGSTLTVAVRGDLGAGPTQLLDAAV
ncbi:MAG: hypothetical protein ACOYOP_09995 [Microthrixaceae bacterium]